MAWSREGSCTVSLGSIAFLSLTAGCIAGIATVIVQTNQLYTPPSTTSSTLPQISLGRFPATASQSVVPIGAQQAVASVDVLAETPQATVMPAVNWASVLLPIAALGGLAYWFQIASQRAVTELLPQEDSWAMAATASELRSRLQTVKNSKKITDAMKLVASAKLRRAQEAVVQSRPFSEALQGVFGEVIRRIEGTEVASDPLLKEREIKSITLVIIGGDRGLCGGYNNQLIKRSSIRFNELLAQGYNVKCITIGKKVTTWYKNRRQKYPMVASYDCGTAVPKVPALVEELIASYLSGETDTVELLYTNFVSLVKSNPGTRSLLPFKPTSATNQEVDEVCRLTTREGKLAVECEPGEVPKNLLEADMLFEQPAQEILDSLIPLYLNSQLVRTLQESVASELAARMTSMQNASDNAKELGRQLNLQYNRLRQASVTSSLLEIVAGATATS